jgi:hypothetical protein
MVRVLIIGIFFALFPALCYADNLAERVKEYYTNINSGKSMEENDWISKKARGTRMWQVLGGLSARVKGITAEAQQHSGLKSVQVLKTSKKGKQFSMSVEITYNDNSKHEESEYWIKEDGKWKLTLPPDYKDTFAP